MKKCISFLLFCSLSASLHTLETFTVNDKIESPIITRLFKILQRCNNSYMKHGKITPAWFSHSTDFKNTVHPIKSDPHNFPIVPHSKVLNLPTINIDKDHESIFHKALGSIEPMSQKLYSYDAEFVKKIFYGIVHHHFVVVKHQGKHVIVFGTKCPNEAKKSASDTKAAIKAFKSKLPFKLKLKIAMIMLGR